MNATSKMFPRGLSCNYKNFLVSERSEKELRKNNNLSYVASKASNKGKQSCRSMRPNHVSVPWLSYRAWLKMPRCLFLQQKTSFNPSDFESIRFLSLFDNDNLFICIRESFFIYSSKNLKKIRKSTSKKFVLPKKVIFSFNGTFLLSFDYPWDIPK